ncbi:MAG: hypothetical protein LVR00_04120 [Rhabdochlamydiaceae bacterium]
MAEISVPDFTVVDGSNRFIRKGLLRFSRALQDSEVGLEGLEEAVIQRSTQESSLPQDPRTRIAIDALRARHGEHIAESLLPYVWKAYPFDHDQGQQAIARAISYAFRGRSADARAYITGLLRSHPRGNEIDPHTMAFPPRIVILDLLIELLGLQDPFISEIRAFNQALIDSNNAPQMLMGFAREISLRTQIFTSNPNLKTYADLLKMKIAYQALKKNHFGKTVAIGGFLKLAIDQAELSMANSLDQIKLFASRCNPDELTRTLLEMPDDPALRDYPEKSVEKVFRIQQQCSLPVTYEAPFSCLLEEIL